MWCGVADEPVVVINPQPMKAGNRSEGKTEGTMHKVAAGYKEPKAFMLVKGRR